MAYDWLAAELSGLKILVNLHSFDKNCLAWLLIGCRLAASQSEAMFENSCQMIWILIMKFLSKSRCQGPTSLTVHELKI